jgi:23S rRNA (cytidine1920-2'-O)/16S rRNA (cytidine1409-2'-O)-methyltransferase
VEDRRAAILDVATASGCAVMGFAPSGLPGPKGNRETFVWLAERGRAGAVADVEAAAGAVEA